MTGTLYLVPTPIGNDGDVTLRALETLKRVALVAAEDTRDAQALLRRLGIAKRLVSYHDHNERSRSRWLVARLRAGQDVALVSDAGTAGLSDPGFRLVQLAIAENVPVCSLPGASAVVTALVASGLPTDRFYFVGFLSRKGGPRRAAIEELKAHPSTLVLFEGPHRLLQTLGDLRDLLGDRRAAAAWNLSKPGERYFRGTLSELLAEFTSWEYVHGEIVLVVAGAGAESARRDDRDERAEDAMRRLLQAGVPLRTVRDVVAELAGLNRRDAYRRVLELARELGLSAAASASDEEPQ